MAARRTARLGGPLIVRRVVVVEAVAAAVLASCLLPAAGCARRPAPVAAAAREIALDAGDGFVWRGRHCRIVHLDAPEVAAPHFTGDQEPWASRAKDRLRALLDGAKKIEILDLRHPDKYDRALVQLYLDGVPASVPLLREGLAWEQVTRYGDDGLPDDARLALEAWGAGPKPLPFDEPWAWRRAHAKVARRD